MAIASMLVNAGPSLPAKSQNVTRKAEKNPERANQRPRAKAYSGFHKQIVRNATRQFPMKKPIKKLKYVFVPTCLEA